MIRVDDVTRIWNHNIPQNAMERLLEEFVKAQYNDGLRTVRNKLCAHYQTPTGILARMDLLVYSVQLIMPRLPV